MIITLYNSLPNLLIIQLGNILRNITKRKTLNENIGSWICYQTLSVSRWKYSEQSANLLLQLYAYSIYISFNTNNTCDLIDRINVTQWPKSALLDVNGVTDEHNLLSCGGRRTWVVPNGGPMAIFSSRFDTAMRDKSKVWEQLEYPKCIRIYN